MQSNENISGINILGRRAVCPFHALPLEWEIYRDEQWVYVEFLDGNEKHLRGSTAWIPYSIVNQEDINQ